MSETNCKQTVHSVCCKVPLLYIVEYFGKIVEDFFVCEVFWVSPTELFLTMPFLRGI